MSVSASVPELDPEVATPPARLHLVAAHDHAWQLVSVDYDEGLEVRHFECAGCGDVLFR